MLWLNGHLLPTHEARIHPTDRGLLLGDGVFETLRGTTHFTRHLARLRNGAAILGIAIPWTDADIAAAATAVLAGRDAALRITLSRGPGPRGLVAPAGTTPTLLLAASPLPPPPPPAHVIIARTTRRNEHSPLARIKSLNYLDSILARQEAATAGADDAILLNTAGQVCEATAANLFVRHATTWTTPPVADGALPGITRALLLEAGFATEATLTPARLLTADAAFLASSLGLRGVASVDGRVMPARVAFDSERQAVLF